MRTLQLASTVVFSLLICCSAFAGSTASRDILPLKPTEKTLPNGLKVIVVRTGFPNVVSVQIPVQTGSRNEFESGKTGFAHFFEHMMFRGTAEYPPEKYNQIVTQAGARQNAYTTDDFTNYHTTFAKQDLETILKIEADRFQHLSYPIEAFKTESRAVLGEYNKNSASPFQKLFEVMRDTAYTTHTYKHTTMGFIQDIENMPNQFEYSKTFFERWYRPEYTTIIVAGDVNPPEVVRLVEKYWGNWKRGTFRADIPQEPEPQGPKYAHVPWNSDTLPILTVSFHGPAFSETKPDLPAMDILYDLNFGPTSDLYRRLVQREQKVDSLSAFVQVNADPGLTTVNARVKKIEDVIYVRDAILGTLAQAKAEAVSEQKLADAKSNARYSFARALDNTETIASVLARFVRLRRSFDTLNKYYRLYDALTPNDLLKAARTYLTDQRMVVVTLSKDAMPDAIARLPPLASFQQKVAGAEIPFIVQKNALPQLNIKLSFATGSAYDPKGKEGLGYLSGSMIANAGSTEMPIDEIRRALFPMSGSFTAQVDKEMTVFTGSIHRDNWRKFFEITLPMLLSPGFREEDFRRLKDNQLNALKQDLRNNNEEELGKERLQANLFRGTPFGHPVLGTLTGIQQIALNDAKDYWRGRYTRGNLTVGVVGDAPDEMLARLKQALSALPEGTPSAPAAISAQQPKGIEVEIIQKDTRATAISLGHPIELTRGDPDFPALWLARAWLGEHRASSSHLFQRIREVRGLNYGDYAYIEAFPRAGAQFFPSPNVARRKQIFEIWIRPVVPANAHASLRIAVYELQKLIDKGLTQEQFAQTRDYLMKNVYLITSTEDQQNGYTLDSKFYGIGEFTQYMRDKLSKLSVEDVNRVIRKYLSAKSLSVVMVAPDAVALKDKLVSDAPSPLTYDAPKPPEVLEEDKVISAIKLNIKPANVRITPVDEVFARDAASELSAKN
ncbi:MAG TPA: pitrilysin family protein [Myxococcaceae bacterium]|nr:pitrilysin family protein [Myxococcaceae bacterium]